MNRIFFLFLVLTGFWQMGICQSERQVRKFVNKQLSWYPHLHLIDLYKSCYQDFMGAEHLVTSSEVAYQYVRKELNEMDSATVQESLPEPCGLRGNHIRIPLSMVKSGMIPVDSLVFWFVQSAGTEPQHSLDEWITYWSKIEHIIDQMNLNLADYEKDKVFIQTLFSRGSYASVHSLEYKQLYHPHYRIVSRKIVLRNKQFIPRSMLLR